MKPLNTIVILATILLSGTSTFAMGRSHQPATCDLTVTPRVISRGDAIGTISFYSKKVSGRRYFRLQNDYFQNQKWLEREQDRALNACRDEIRENAPEEILVDTPEVFVSGRYQCSSPELIVSSSRYNHRAEDSQQYRVTLTVFEPGISETLTPEIIVTRKCEKLTRCMASATTSEAIEQLQSLQIQLGCM